MEYLGRGFFLKAFMLFVASIALWQGIARAAVPEAGKIAIANGDVRIAKNADEPGTAANAGYPVTNTDVIKTGENSSAKILFTDETIMDLGANSALHISNYALKNVENRTGTFSLLYGKLRGLVTKKVGEKGDFQVKTPSAVMGVRGTEWFIAQPPAIPGLPPPPPLIVCVSGKINITPVAGGPSIQLAPGQAITATAEAIAQAVTAAKEAPKEAPGDKGPPTGEKGPPSGEPGPPVGDKGPGLPFADVGFKPGEGNMPPPMTGVMTVSKEQILDMKSNFKIVDATFISAVTISTAGPAGPGGQATQGPPIIMPDKAPPPPSETAGFQKPPPLPPPPPPPPPIIPGGERVKLTVTVQ
jgi:hypothetical protein